MVWKGEETKMSDPNVDVSKLPKPLDPKVGIALDPRFKNKRGHFDLYGDLEQPWCPYDEWDGMGYEEGEW